MHLSVEPGPGTFDRSSAMTHGSSRHRRVDRFGGQHGSVASESPPSTPRNFMTASEPTRSPRSQVALLIAQGKHPKVIADRLGHTSVRTVLDV